MLPVILLIVLFFALQLLLQLNKVMRYNEVSSGRGELYEEERSCADFVNNSCTCY